MLIILISTTFTRYLKEIPFFKFLSSFYSSFMEFNIFCCINSKYGLYFFIEDT